MADSPTVRSMRYLRERGYIVDKVEYWNPFSKTRKDLFGFIDLIAIKPGEILGVQTTTGAHFANRKAKAEARPEYDTWLDAGCKFVVHGWRKLKSGKWEVRTT